MKILVAPNSMKGSLSAFDFADTVEKALLNYSPKFKVRKVPVADGGDFTGEILAKALNAKSVYVEVRNPLGKTINSKYFISGKTAIIEMADASGMKLIGKIDLNPLKTSSFGTGELIADAIKKGCGEIFLAI
jgi:glycerate kinase